MGDASTLPLFIYPIFILFITTVLNLLWRKFSPSSCLRKNELLVIYIMVVVSSTFLGESMLAGMLGSITYPFRYATPENEWKELFFKYIPSWLTVRDEKVLEGFYRGESSIYFYDNLKAWFFPLAAWGAFTFALVFIMLCINIILRKQWGEREKLAFPIIQLPLKMTEENGLSRFFSNKVMWIGFSIPAVIDLINGFHDIYPAVPSMQWIKYQWGFFGRYFTQKPWNAISSEGLSLYPFAIGIGFFLPVDLLFSCWFFYLIRMAERIFGSIAGWQTLPQFPYFDEQGSGAWIGLCIIALWASRKYLKEVFFFAVGRKANLADTDEPMKYRNALFGIVLGLVFLLFFCDRAGMSCRKYLKEVFFFAVGRKANLADTDEPMKYRNALFGIVLGLVFLLFFCDRAGMSWWVTISFFAIFYMVALAITRVRAEFGSMHEILFVNPRKILVRFLGTRAFGPRNLTVMSFIDWFNFSQSCHPMPGQFEAFKMGEINGFCNKRLFNILVLATIGSIVGCFWIILDFLYRGGAEAEILGLPQFVGSYNFSPLERWLTNPVSPDAPGMVFMGIGFLITVIFTAMRMRFFWWPFHPAGYALAVSFAMDYFWFALFLTWIAKSIILKVGGIRLHRQAIPFFLGLILGDYVVGSIWAIVAPLISKPSYSIFI